MTSFKNRVTAMYVSLFTCQRLCLETCSFQLLLFVSGTQGSNDILEKADICEGTDETNSYLLALATRLAPREEKCGFVVAPSMTDFQTASEARSGPVPVATHLLVLFHIALTRCCYSDRYIRAFEGILKP